MASFITTVAASSVLAAALNQLFTWYWSRRAEKRDAQISALYVSYHLHNFASACSHMYAEKDAYISTDGHHGVDHTCLPPFPEYSDKIEWRAIGAKTTQTAFSYRTGVEAVDQYILSGYEADGSELGDPALTDGLIDLGLRAFNDAKMIRSRHKIPDPIQMVEWSPEKYLVERKNARDRRKLEFRDRIRREALERAAAADADASTNSPETTV